MSFLSDGLDKALATILLAHGAGAPIDSAPMNAIADVPAGAGFRVARFEFAYIATRREGKRKPPPKAELFLDEYRTAIEELSATGLLIIGGKSMGGRVASMAADELLADGRIAGSQCLGYPFHPPAKPQQPRPAHLADLKTPTLIFLGARDPFGTREEVEGYGLSDQIGILWL